MDALVEALQRAGIAVSSDNEALDFDGHAIAVTPLERSHPTPSELRGMEFEDQDTLVVIIADRLSATSKDWLRLNGVGWLDRRGHVRLWGRGIYVDVHFEPSDVQMERRAPKDFTPAVREVALALLLRPLEAASPRNLARRTDRSPGYISTILGGLKFDGLLREDDRPLTPELFWALADAWEPDWLPLADDLADLLSEGLAAETDAGAAARWGAPVFRLEASENHLVVSSDGVLKRLSSRASPTRPELIKTFVRHEAGFAEATIRSPALGPTTAHPVVCALDLAQDERGRELVREWRPRHSNLGKLAALDVYRNAGWVQTNWLEDIIESGLPAPLWSAVAATAWGRWTCEGLAVLVQHPDTPSDLRSEVERRMRHLAGEGDEAIRSIVAYAPSLLRDPWYRNRAPSSAERRDSQGEDIAHTIAELYRRPGPLNRDAIYEAAQNWTDVVSTSLDPWAIRRGARYLARLQGDVDYSDALSERLAGLAQHELPRRIGLGGSFKWAEWSAGEDPAWYPLSRQAQQIAPNGQLGEALRLLKQIREAEQEDRAMPLVDLLPALPEHDREVALQEIVRCADSVSDLHVRAKVLAEASEFAQEDQVRDILDRAFEAGRAAVRQPESSRLGGPEPGGIRGLLEVALHGTGDWKEAALEETAVLWVEWLTGASGAEGGRRPDRWMFHSGGDSTLPLVQLLAEAELIDSLSDVFQCLRATAGEDGNVLEGYLAMGAWPALGNGNLELAALFVEQARRPTPWRAAQDSNGPDDSEVGSTNAPDAPTFPDELIGFRCVWR
ncbi:MAG: hypothetical protein GY788_31625 [bacterium]|nr:hypothetical protein [bacterium]